MFTAVSLPWFATCQKCLYEAGIWESIDYSMGSMVDECWLRLHSLLFRASVHHVAVTQQQVCSRRKGLGVPSHQTTIPGRASLSSVKSCKVSIYIPLFKLLWGGGNATYTVLETPRFLRFRVDYSRHSARPQLTRTCLVNVVGSQEY